MADLVNIDNFVRAESNLMFSRLVTDAGGVGRWVHNRIPAPLDRQLIVRLNRDTLYSTAIVDVSAGAALTIPEVGSRYVSAMVVNQDHFIPLVLRDPGEHRLREADLGTRFVLVAVRMLVDPNDPDDVARVNRLQDGLGLVADSNADFELPAYDEASHVATRNALLELARGVPDFRRSFGRPDEVDPRRHLVATASGWGGLPEYEAHYVNVDPGLPVGAYRMRMVDVPVDAFWSISVYNAEGYFVPNDLGVNNINSVTATLDDDGACTVHFGTDPSGLPNFLPIVEGWNFLIRLYRPRPEVLDGTWTPPPIEAMD